MDQIQLELDAIRAAWYAQRVYSDKKLRTKIDGAYILWIDGDQPDPIRFAGGRWLDNGIDIGPS